MAKPSSRRMTGRCVSQRSLESLSSPLSLVSEPLSLPESEESLSSPLSPSESEESASPPLSPSLTVAPPWARVPGQTVLISSSSSRVLSAPMPRPPPEPTASLRYLPRRATATRPRHAGATVACRVPISLADAYPALSTAAGYQRWITRRCGRRLLLARLG